MQYGLLFQLMHRAAEDYIAHYRKVFLRFDICAFVQYTGSFVQEPLARLSNLLKISTNARQLFSSVNVRGQLLRLLQQVREVLGGWHFLSTLVFSQPVA